MFYFFESNKWKDQKISSSIFHDTVDDFVSFEKIKSEVQFDKSVPFAKLDHKGLKLKNLKNQKQIVFEKNKRKHFT